jgi:hypothetical protein
MALCPRISLVQNRLSARVAISPEGACVIAGSNGNRTGAPGSPTCPGLPWERTWAEKDGATRISYYAALTNDHVCGFQ